MWGWGVGPGETCSTVVEPRPQNRRKLRPAPKRVVRACLTLCVCTLTGVHRIADFNRDRQQYDAERRERLSRATRASASSTRIKSPQSASKGGKPPSPQKQKRPPQQTKAEAAVIVDDDTKSELEGDETDSTHSSEEPTKPSASFLSQILGTSPQQDSQPRIEMPDDVRAWLQHGGASTAAEGALIAASDAAGHSASGFDLLEALDVAELQDAAETSLVGAAADARRVSGRLRPDYNEPEPSPQTAVFVHFIPPPMRENGKKDLAWIVHTCDGSGCREARHVQFHSISGFSTFEGTPPEQTAGRACDCAIANHHLRGFGKPRWQGDVAIIEHHGGQSVGGGGGDGANDSSAMVNVRAYREEARRQATQLARARRGDQKAARAARRDDEGGRRRRRRARCRRGTCARELALMKQKKTAAEDRYRHLKVHYEALKTANPGRGTLAPAASAMVETQGAKAGTLSGPPRRPSWAMKRRVMRRSIRPGKSR